MRVCRTAEQNTNRRKHHQLPNTMETKYRTLLQAAVMLLVLALIVINHGGDKGEQSVAQKSVHARR
jgi:hypothetical protein